MSPIINVRRRFNYVDTTPVEPAPPVQPGDYGFPQNEPTYGAPVDVAPPPEPNPSLIGPQLNEAGAQEGVGISPPGYDPGSWALMNGVRVGNKVPEP